MAFFFHSTAGLVVAECACTCLVSTSYNDVQSLVCVDPKYLNWATSSSTFPFIHMLVEGLGLMLLTRVLLLPELISIPYSAAIFCYLSVSCCSSSLPARSSISSANCKLQNSRRLVDTDDGEVSNSSAFSAKWSAVAFWLLQRRAICQHFHCRRKDATWSHKRVRCVLPTHSHWWASCCVSLDGHLRYLFFSEAISIPDYLMALMEVFVL